MRIGHGFDVHRFSDDPARALWLGLTRIDNARGLDGHSDADAVTHAVCDALLGAAGLGDIGEHFSDTDARWRGVASRVLLEATLALVDEAGWTVGNVDVTVMAEQPRLRDLKAVMASALSDVVHAPVSVKATTLETLGALGRGEGIAATAVALIKEKP